MGLMEGWGLGVTPDMDLRSGIYPNASKCATRDAVEETNRNKHKRVMEFKDLFL